MFQGHTLEQAQARIAELEPELNLRSLLIRNFVSASSETKAFLAYKNFEDDLCTEFFYDGDSDIDDKEEKERINNNILTPEVDLEMRKRSDLDFCSSFLFTKEFVNSGLDNGVRPLGEIFGKARESELILVGGGRGSRYRNNQRNRGGVRRRPTVKGRRINNRRKRSNRSLGVIQPGRFMPDVFFATLRYDDINYNRTLTGGVYNWFFQSNAYQCDPTGTAAAVPGFTEINAMYTKWRVNKIVMHYTLTGTNADPVIFVTFPSVTAYTAGTLTKTQLTEYSSNPGGRRTLCGNTGGGVTRGMCVATGLKLFGPPFRFDDDYWAVGSGAPTIPYYINCGIFDTVAAEALPLVTDIRVEMVVEFSGLRSLLS